METCLMLKALVNNNSDVAELNLSSLGWKTLWEMEKCCLPAFSSFPTMFSKTCPMLKALVDNNSDVAQLMQSVNVRVENFVGNGENAAYQHLLLFHQCFQKPIAFGWYNLGL